MRFLCIARALELPIVDVQHRNVWLGLTAQTGYTAAIFEGTPALVCDGAMLLESQNHRKMTHFIATCRRAFRHKARFTQRRL